MAVDVEQSEFDLLVSTLLEEAGRIIGEVESDADRRDVVAAVMPNVKALMAAKSSVPSPRDQDTWTQIRELLMKAAYATRPYCIRCGRCCVSGSPILLEDDQELFVKNILRPVHVMTIRKGEITYSAVSRELSPAGTEMIKIREIPAGKTCIFYEPEAKACAIYASRPMQCRTQQCWNPMNYETIAGKPQLERKGLLSVTGDLWEVIRQHEQRCSYTELARVMARLAATKGRTIAEVLDLLAYDDHVRTFTVERLGLDPGIMDFLFGRPMRDAMRGYGLKIEDQPDGSVMVTPLAYDAASPDPPCY